MATSSSVLKNVLITVMSENSNLWIHCIIFGAQDWNRVINLDGAEVKKLSKPHHNSKKKPDLYDGMDVDKKDFDIDKKKVWKKDNAFKTPWGTATVMSVHKNKDLEVKFDGYGGE
jgi:hypothetical protein